MSDIARALGIPWLNEVGRRTTQPQGFAFGIL